MTVSFVRVLRVLLLLAAAGMLQACATPGRTTNADPWQGFNRGAYKFNDTLDRAALKPVAKGYQKVTPQWLRTGVRNFFDNLGTPWTMVNQLLQGKPQHMAHDTCRFVLNTVVGLAGTIDVAGKLGMADNDEDFGQTLAVWGAPSGPYLVLPIFGPSNVRDGLGRIPDWLLGRPQRYADLTDVQSYSLTALNVVSSRERLLSYEGTLNNAYDPYGVMRDVWVQNREHEVFDGNPPVDIPEDESGELDEEDAAAEAASQDEDQAAASETAEQPAADGAAVSGK